MLAHRSTLHLLGVLCMSPPQDRTKVRLHSVPSCHGGGPSTSIPGGDPFSSLPSLSGDPCWPPGREAETAAPMPTWPPSGVVPSRSYSRVLSARETLGRVGGGGFCVQTQHEWCGVLSGIAPSALEVSAYRLPGGGNPHLWVYITALP